MRERLRVGAGRGMAYRDLEPDLLREARDWMQSGRVADGLELAPHVFRRGERVIKFFKRAGNRLRLRRSRVVRSAERHARLHWVPVPAPHLALEFPRSHELEGLLVMRFVAGSGLDAVAQDASSSAAGALEELGPFLARLHARGVHHGDLHPQNLLWDEETWWLLDLESVRGPLHRLYARRLALRQWGRLRQRLGGGDLLRPAFERYARARSRGVGVDALWAEVEAEGLRGERERAERRRRRELEG